MVFESPGGQGTNKGPLDGLGTASRLGPLHNAGMMIIRNIHYKGWLSLLWELYVST
jgi:hypothetical protein